MHQCMLTLSCCKIMRHLSFICICSVHNVRPVFYSKVTVQHYSIFQQQKKKKETIVKKRKQKQQKIIKEISRLNLEGQHRCVRTKHLSISLVSGFKYIRAFRSESLRTVNDLTSSKFSVIQLKVKHMTSLYHTVIKTFVMEQIVRPYFQKIANTNQY